MLVVLTIVTIADLNIFMSNPTSVYLTPNGGIQPPKSPLTRTSNEASGPSYLDSTARKAGEVVRATWIASCERAARLAALLDHYGKQLEMAIGSASDGDERSDRSHRNTANKTIH